MAKLVARLRAAAAIWIRIQTYPSKLIREHRQLAGKKNILGCLSETAPAKTQDGSTKIHKLVISIV